MITNNEILAHKFEPRIFFPTDLKGLDIVGQPEMSFDKECDSILYFAL